MCGVLFTPVFMDDGIIDWTQCQDQLESGSVDFECDYRVYKVWGWNVVGLAAISLWSAIATGPMFFVLKKIGWLRVSEDIEVKGLDIKKHGETAYPAAAYGHGWDAEGDFRMSTLNTEGQQGRRDVRLLANPNEKDSWENQNVSEDGLIALAIGYKRKHYKGDKLFNISEKSDKNGVVENVDTTSIEEPVEDNSHVENVADSVENNDVVESVEKVEDKGIRNVENFNDEETTKESTELEINRKNKNLSGEGKTEIVEELTEPIKGINKIETAKNCDEKIKDVEINETEVAEEEANDSVANGEIVDSERKVNPEAKVPTNIYPELKTNDTIENVEENKETTQPSKSTEQNE